MSELAQPAPQKISVGQATFGESKFTVMQFESVNGSWIVFLPDAEVRQFANQLIQATTGIVVAPANAELPALELPR